MLKIGDFSKLTHISVRMLRHYDEYELLKPDKIDSNSGYRFYNVNQLEIANMIKKLSSLGFSIKSIKEIVDNKENVDGIFNRRIDQLNEELGNLKKVREELDLLSKDGFRKIQYNVIKKKFMSRKVIAFRKIVNSYYSESELWEELFKEISKLNIRISKNASAVAVFHDFEFKENDVDIEVNIDIEGDYEIDSRFSIYDTDDINIVSVIFNGSYAKMPEVTKSVIDYIELNNLELIQPTFNIYHVSPAQDGNPDNWITEACFIVKEKES